MKQIIFSIAAIAVMTTFGLPVVTSKSSPQAFATVADALVACTNSQQVQEIAKETMFFRINKHHEELPYAQEAYARVDNALAEKGIGVSPTCWKSFPKCSKISRDEHHIYTNTVFFQLLFKYGAESDLALRHLLSDEEVIQMMNYIISRENRIGQLQAYKKLLQTKHGQKIVKRYLYNQGKSFVTKNGVNPCEPLLQRLNAALNAPRLNGLNEWFSDVGLSGRIDLSFLPSNEVIQTLKQDILVGKKDPTDKDLFNLYMCLSISDYNAFIDRYNNGTK